MFVDATLYRKLPKSVIIDTGDTYYFTSNIETCCLGIKLKKDVGHMKAIIRLGK